MIKKKYRALRFIAFVFQVLAWVSLVLGILGALGALVAGLMNVYTISALDQLQGFSGSTAASVIAGVISMVVVLVIGVVNFIVLLATAEYFYVLIDTEQNTRAGADYLRQLVQAQQPVAVAPVASVVPLAPEPYPAEPTVTVQTTPAPK